jgi:ankyrin repeat protein
LLKGADPNLQDSLGMTVLHYAVLQPHLPLIKLLIETGSSVHAIDREGRIPLHYLARCDENDVEISDLEEIVRLLSGGNTTTVSAALLNKPVSGLPRLTEDQSNRKRSSLVQKVTRVRNVISHRPEEDDARTPIEISLLGSRWKIARILAGFGAVMPPNMDVAPVIDLAVKDMQADIINLLLQYGAPTPPASVVTLVKSFISDSQTSRLQIMTSIRRLSAF